MIESLLKKNFLAPEDVLVEVSHLMRNGDSDSIRLRAAEMGAKLNGLLSENQIKQVPIFNIIINDSQALSINPILIPR